MSTTILKLTEFDISDTKQAARTVRCAAVCVVAVTSFAQDDDNDQNNE